VHGKRQSCALNAALALGDDTWVENLGETSPRNIVHTKATAKEGCRCCIVHFEEVKFEKALGIPMAQLEYNHPLRRGFKMHACDFHLVYVAAWQTHPEIGPITTPS
jgi:hypothetical protein